MQSQNVRSKQVSQYSERLPFGLSLRGAAERTVRGGLTVNLLLGLLLGLSAGMWVIAFASEVVAQEPAQTDPSALLTEAANKYSEKKYDEAAVLYTKLIKLKPTQTSAYEGLGKVYRRQKKWSEAKRGR